MQLVNPSYVKLELLNQRNLFYDVPSLNTIWPGKSARYAAEATSIDWDSGQIFLIKYMDSICGMTGFFFDSDHPEAVYLRWTGVLPEYRGMGMAASALPQLARILEGTLTDRLLVELVPDTEHGKTKVAPFFEKMGFTKQDDSLRLPSEETDHSMIPYGMLVKDLAKVQR